MQGLSDKKITSTLPIIVFMRINIDSTENMSFKPTHVEKGTQLQFAHFIQI